MKSFLRTILSIGRRPTISPTGTRVAPPSSPATGQANNALDQKTKESIDELRKAAEQGDAKAQSDLGLMYEQGQGVPQDYAEAVRWYRKAADQGHAGAQLFLGLMYDRGQGVPQDYAEAVHWFCKAADQGRALAQVKLAESYSHGQGVPQDYAEAARWYRKAADQGLAVAQCNLGVRYDKGQGVPQDYAEAVQWYRKAAEQGLAAAQLSLGSMYYRGQGVPQDYAEAARWLCKAAEQGEALAQFILGGMYQQGEGMTQDGVQALIWFNLAASRASGDLKQLCVGALDVVAKGLTAEQRVEAQRLVREWKPKGGGKAHDQETSVSSPQQGTFYCDICNEPLDVQKAYLLTTSQVVLSAAHWEFFWRHYPDHAARAGERGEKLSSYAIEKAADLTHWSVCQRCVGLCTEQPAASARSFREQVRFDGGTLIAPLCGPPPDWKLAVAAAEEAWAKAFGSRPLKNLGGSILSASLAVYDKSCRRWNIERFSAHRKAAEQGDAVAQSVLGSCYASGAGVEQDHAEAAKWWRKAAEQGDVGAQYSLGVCYAKGNGVAKDQPEAVRWFRKAAEQGHADAQGVLGDRFDEGEGVGQDHAEAVKWYRKAAEQGIAAAQNNLGACYVKGEGVVEDHSEAAKWWRKAAEQGVAIAQYNLGVCYAKGDGVGQDEREAVKWWRKAAKQGNALAQNELSARQDKGETVGQDPTEGAARLVCPKCKKRYHIGVDAGIVGMEDVFASFIAHGGTAVYAAGPPGDADPYLVGAYPSASEGDSATHVATCQRIRDRLRSGGRPTWYCGACKTESGHYEFPSDF